MLRALRCRLSAVAGPRTPTQLDPVTVQALFSEESAKSECWAVTEHGADSRRPLRPTPPEALASVAGDGLDSLKM